MSLRGLFGSTDDASSILHKASMVQQTLETPGWKEVIGPSLRQFKHALQGKWQQAEDPKQETVYMARLFAIEWLEMWIERYAQDGVTARRYLAAVSDRNKGT